jgi:hypothetical protein
MHLLSLAAFGWTPRLFLRDENARDSGKLEIWAVNGVRSLPLQEPPALNCESKCCTAQLLSRVRQVAPR